MKKLKLVMLLMVMLTVITLAFAACDNSGNKPEESSNAEHTHVFSDATCTAPKTCECGATEGEALGHTIVADSAVDATCTETGLTAGEHCSVCDEVIIAQETVPAKGHSYETTVTAPTCTEDGYTTHTCACGDVYTDSKVEATGHSFVDGKCACGAADPDYVPHEHSYKTTVTAPTCTEAGFTTYTCDCGDTYTADEVKATGHSFVDGKCACGAADPDYVPHEHSYKTTVTAPTCTEAGFTTYTCDCGDTYTADEVEATGHSYNSVVTAPTCENEGYTTYTCANCDDSYTDDKVAALGHTFIDSKCTCGAEYVAPLAPWVLVTELNDGDKILIGASAYGKLLSAEKVSAGSYYNKGVDYSADNFANVTDAEIFVVSVNDNGEYTFTSLTGVVIALADSYSSLNNTGVNKTWTLEKRDDGTFLVKNVGRGMYLEWYASKGNWSTYSAGNTKEYYLSFYLMTGATEEEHVHNHITSVVAPTCEGEGYTSYTCACGDTYKKDIVEATGHSYSSTVVAPTCEEAGYTSYTCSCGASYKENEVDALGHSYVEGVCPVCGKEDPDYVKPEDPSTPANGEADLDAIVLPSNKVNGDSSYTGTYTSPNGWVTNYSAIQTGGATVLNPQYPVIGPDNTHKAVCLNGKVSAPGKITSPTLTTGISKFTINYTKIFSDTELSVTVTVTDAEGNKQTHVIAKTLPSTEKYVVYTDVWTLDTPVVGDFTIEIVNNCPSGATGNKDRMTILDITWEGAVATHTHKYTSTTTATCTTAGITTYTCDCGDTYTEETEKLGHVDANLDIDCDVDGCTGKVAPPADSVLSNFTANNLGSKLSTSVNYYVVGTIVEVLDARNGIFLIDDGTGEKFYFRMPKNAEGTVHSSWEIKLVLGDKVQVYGKVNKFSTTSAPNGSYWPAIQSGVVTVLEQHPHDYTAKEADCFNPAYCVCGQASAEGPKAHYDNNTDDLCDNCGYKMGSKVDFIKTHFNDVKETSNYDATNGTALWESDEFSVLVSKGTATFNSNGTNHFRLQKGNNLTITAKNGNKIVGIVFTVSASSYTDELETILTTAGIEYTLNELELTISVDSLDSFKLDNTASKIARIATIAVIYTEA